MWESKLRLTTLDLAGALFHRDFNFIWPMIGIVVTTHTL